MITAICLLAGISGVTTLGVIAAGMAARKTVVWSEGELQEMDHKSGPEKSTANGMLVPAHGH